jgi:hypothetical protein
MKAQGRPPIGGIVHANIQIPENLHESMKALRQVRHEQEGADVKLCRIYREAVEQYLSAKPQQRLLRQASAMRAAG